VVVWDWCLRFEASKVDPTLNLSTSSFHFPNMLPSF
jgi:hypothetical protein